MRIGIVSTWFERGAAYVSRQYRDLLRREGNEVFIYARGGERYAVGDPEWDTPEVTWGAAAPVKVVTPIHKREFLRWIADNRLDTVLFNEQWWLPPVVWAREAGCKTIGYVDYYTERTVERFAVYDGLICNTRRHHSVFSWHPSCLYLPWGTDVSLFRPLEDGVRSEKGPVFFLSAGLNPARKGADLALRAFARLTGEAFFVLHIQSGAFDTIPDVRSLADELVQQGRLKIYDQEVPAPGLYHLGDVYVYPSRLDGIGLTQAEALACGLPLIVPDNPPMNEFITPDSGLAVPVDKLWARWDGYYWPQCLASVDGLQVAMQMFVDDFASLARRKRQARAYAEEHLDWYKNGAGLNDWLTSLKNHEIPAGMLRDIRREERKAPASSCALLKRSTTLSRLLKLKRNK